MVPLLSEVTARTTSAMVVSPLCWMAWAVMIVTGASVSTVVRGTAEPVTSMRPSWVARCGTVVVVVVVLGAGAVAAWGAAPVAAGGVSAWAAVQAAALTNREMRIFRR